MKTKAILSLVTAALLASVSPVNASNVSLSDNDRDYVYVESPDSGDAPMYDVVAIIERAGYHRVASSVIPPKTRTDTWCRVSVHNEREILVECYTPHQGYGITIRDHVVTFNGDYSGVPDKVKQLRDEHRRVSAYLVRSSPESVPHFSR